MLHYLLPPSLRDFAIRVASVSVGGDHDFTFRPRIGTDFRWPKGSKAAVVLSLDIDDHSCASLLKDVAYIFYSYGAKATVNVLSQGGYALDYDFIQSLYRSGWEIASHGLNHIRVDEVSIKMSKVMLEARLKVPIKGFRAPSLRFSPMLLKPLIEAGYIYDSSLPDTSKGAGLLVKWRNVEALTIYPFLIGPLVELPVTTPIDNHLFKYLKLNILKSFKYLRNKILWSYRKGGLILLLLHPSYYNSYERKIFLRMLLSFLTSMPDIWLTTAIDVANYIKTNMGVKGFDQAEGA